jgi:hypothetical protein
MILAAEGAAAEITVECFKGRPDTKIAKYIRLSGWYVHKSPPRALQFRLRVKYGNRPAASTVWAVDRLGMRILPPVSSGRH